MITSKTGVFVYSAFTVILLVTLSVIAWAQSNPNPCTGATDVCTLTWQQDSNLPAGSACSGCSYRTGENLLEPVLIPSAIQNSHFGQLCSAGLDGQVFAQPLVVTDVTMTVNGGQHFYPLVAYVVTMYDTLYAISGTPPGSNPSSGPC